MNRLTVVLEKLAQAMNIVAVLAALLMTVVVFSSAVMRYLVGSPLMFSDELAGLLFVSMAFLAMPLGLMQRRHISVDIVARHLPPRLQGLAECLGILIFVVFAVWFIWEAYGFAAFSRMIGSRSDIGSLVLWPWMAIMPLCTLVLTLVALSQLIGAIRVLLGKETPHTAAGESLL